VAVDVVVPEVGEVGGDLTFVGWLKQEGDQVRAGEPIFEIDTGKATVEIEALADGTLVGLSVGSGEIVQPRQVIGRILVEGEQDLPTSTTAGPGAVSSSPAPLPADSHTDERAARAIPTAAEPQPVARAPVGASPRARRLAAEAGIDLASIIGSGPDGMVTERDVQSAVDARAGWGEEVRVTSPSATAPSIAPADVAERARRAVADRTLGAWRQIPHFYLSLEADVTQTFGLARPTVVTVAAFARALAAHPECNLEWKGDSVVRRTTVDLGLLVDTPHGLLLPAVRDADHLDLAALAAALEAAVARARAGSLSSGDLAPRSATISNLGMFAVDRFAAVIAAPDPLTLAVGRARTAPRWNGAGWSPATVVDLTLSVDHRALSGAAAGRLLSTLEAILGDPEKFA
jgi:pyruvate dehydrogenase E2 component (dihydrolipoamide acetyltransferase)